METVNKPKSKLVGALQDNSQLILGIGAGLGFIATIFFTHSGTKKACDILAERDRIFESGASEEEKEKVVTPPSKKEKFDLTWQCYAPAAISAICTFGFMIGGNYISWKKILTLTGTVSFLASERDNFEKAAREKFGDDAVNEVKETLLKKKFSKPEEPKEVVKVKQVAAEETGHGNQLCYESYSGRWFRASEGWVLDAEKRFKDHCKTYHYASLNDLHEMYGIERSKFAIDRGWYYAKWPLSDKGDKEVTDCNFDISTGPEFSHSHMIDEIRGEDVLVIEIIDTPDECYNEI